MNLANLGLKIFKLNYVMILPTQIRPATFWESEIPTFKNELGNFLIAALSKRLPNETLNMKMSTSFYGIRESHFQK